MDNVYFIIPAYNEEENIQTVLNDWYDVVEQCGSQSRLIVIDDGSKDSTYSIMQEFAKTHTQFEPITKPNSGHGATILYGYRYALNQKADYIFQTDSDGQTNPAEFADFWEKRNDYDMVIGRRSKRKDGCSRRFVAKVLKLVILLSFHENVTDANTPFRLMKSETLAKYINLVPNDYNLTNVLISIIFAKKKCKINYIPITFRPRQGGVNSINIKSILEIGKKAIKDFYVIRKNLK